MIARKTWREIGGMTLVYLLLLEVMLVPAVMLWPSVYDDLRRGLSMLSAVKIEFVQRAVAGMRDSNSNTAFLNYLALQQFFKGVNVAGSAAAILLGTGLIARERETQTLEFLLARPVTRARVLWSKTWVAAVCVAAPVFLSSWSTIPVARLIDDDVPFVPLTLCALHNSLFVLLILMLTLIASVLCRVQAHVAFWAGGFVIMQVAQYFIPGARLFSVFRFSDFDLYSPVLMGKHGLGALFVPGETWAPSLWLCLAIVGLYWFAARKFARLEL